MSKQKEKIRNMVIAALVAALYVVLTLLSAAFGLSSGVIQLRLSEALTILPAFTPAAIPGLFAGCLLANLLTGSLPWDVVLGSLATLLGAVGTYYLRRRPLFWAVPPILSNALIIPFVLQWVYGVPDSYPFLLLTVTVGEVLSAGGVGYLLSRVLRRSRLFSPNNK